MFSRIILNQCARSYSTQVLYNEKMPHSLNKERSLNQIQIIGRVGTDPKWNEPVKIKTEEDQEGEKKIQHRVMLFTVATNEYQGRTEEGEARTRVDWHRIVVFNSQLQQNVERYVKQGDRLHVTGKLHYNLIKDKSGFSRYVPGIVAEDIIFLNKAD